MDPDFWGDPSKSNDILQRRSKLQAKLDFIDALQGSYDEVEAALEFSKEDSSFLADATLLMHGFSSQLSKAYIQLSMSGPHDACNAFMTLKAGAGGCEAEDWCLMALRMYTLLFKRVGFSYELIHTSYGGTGGLKQATLHVTGDYVYGYLKGEAGNHRLTRISPYDSKNRRQTSFCGLSIIPEVERTIEVSLNKKEIREDLFRSSGPGGQHANKTSTGVRLTHIPTGLVASCQNTRSQSTNRERAETMLLSKLVSIQEDQHREESEALKGEQHEIGWGRKVRNYCFVPKSLVKDDRTRMSSSNLKSVLDGGLEEMIQAHILFKMNQEERVHA